MILRLLPAVLALLTVTGTCTAIAQNMQESPSEQQSEEAGAGGTNQKIDLPTMPDLMQIESFEVQLDESWRVDSATNDEATALIVNPFTVRKRGRYYGSVYEYHRNDNFDARNAFDPGDKPEYKRNQFGLSLGAFITGKIKVFGSYDGLRIIRGSTFTSRVPTAEMKQGDFSAVANIVDPFTGEPFENNRIPESRIHDVARNLLSLFPEPNASGSGYNYVNSEPIIENNNSISTRIDYEASPQTKIFGAYNISDGNRKRTASLPTFGTTTDEREQDVSIDLTHSFSANKVLNLSVNFSRSVSLTLSDQSFQDGLLASIGIEGVQVLDSMDEGYPQMDILGYAGIGASSGFGGFPGFSSGAPDSFHENRYSIESNYTYVHGNHNISFGGNLSLFQLNNMRTWGTRRGQFGFSGFFTGDPFADFLLGIPYTATRGIGSNRSDLRQRSWRLFIRDSWKINRNFTLSMGLAYSYSPFFHSIHDNVSFFHPLVFDPPLDGEVIVTGSDRARELGLSLDPGHTAYNDKNDWQPNVGIAYSPFGNNRLVIRASYSIRNSPMNPMQALTYMGRNYPFFYIQSAESPTRPDLDIGRPFESAALPALTFKAADPHLRNSFVQDRSISLQYEFLNNWSIELVYEGRKTDRYFRAIPANVPLPAPFGQPIQPRRPNPDYGLFEILKSDASYSSNGMTARVTRRLTSIFSLRADFQWNRAISNAWGWMFANPNNPRNLSAERSLNGFMPTKTFSLNYILDLPVGRDKLLSSRWAGKLAQLFEGWRISGITSIQGGSPFSVEIFGDPNNDGVWGDRPNRIGPGTLPDSERTVAEWFKTSDFVQPDTSGPDPQWFGDSGRNILMSPGSTQWDISLLKQARITAGGHLLEFRIQFFNAFNHVNLDWPDNFINSPSFGQITGADPAREIEIALKYSF
jgi:hypothetical protein